MRNQALIGVGIFIFGLFMAWELGGKIVDNDVSSIAFVALACIAFFVAIKILRNWRLGFYSFLIWLLFEDLVRKYLGNNMAIYFAKDVMVGLTYVALFVDIRRGRAATFRPPFLLFFYLFLWLGLVQVFNSNSPNILYGLMGAKIYFFYVPLMFVSYALIRNDEDLRKFLVVNAVLADDTGAGLEGFGRSRQSQSTYQSNPIASHGRFCEHGALRVLPDCFGNPRHGIRRLSLALYQAQPQVCIRGICLGAQCNAV
jgi:hypothetical protein